MLISLNWVREHCPFETDETPLEVGTRLSLHTAEVEDVIERGAALAGIRAGLVVKVASHPDADRLSLVEVEVGAAETVSVVCGAPNVREGLVVPFAAPGVTIGGRKLKATKVRGVLSHGMLCSAKELEISEDDSGLWELPESLEPGAPLAEVLPNVRDTILEIDNKSLTHRPDLWGHYGMAREFAAIYEVPLTPLEPNPALAEQPGKAAIRVDFEGDIGGPEGLCRRYCGLQLDGIRVEASPQWLQERLLALGSRPINNIVDVTNYVLFELGQPLHAFDTTQVHGQRVVVRRAAAGETLTLLDDSTVELDPEDLVIADAKAPTALAGIMGGKDSEIASSTTSVFLESANFSPVRVRRTSLRVGKRTDSSLRFEKSLDPENARKGILRAAELILQLCPGAKVVGPLQDVGYEPPEVLRIATSAGFLQRRLGIDLAPAQLRAILDRLGFRADGDLDGEWNVTVPSWRATKDVSIQEDLVEEVGRIYGFDRIVPVAPQWPLGAVDVNEQRQLERQAKSFLAIHGGLYEVFTYSMVGVAHCEFFGLDSEGHLKICHPLSEDMDRLRRDLVPQHLVKAKENQRFEQRFGFFELGRVYRKTAAELTQPDLPDERNVLAGVLSFPEKADANFYEIRDLILGLLAWLRSDSVEVVPVEEGRDLPGWIHPAVVARVLVCGEERGLFFRVHPGVEQRLDLRGDVLAFSLDFDAVFASRRRQTNYRPPSRFPTVAFDVAAVAPLRTPVATIEKVIREAAGALLTALDVFDVFVGGQLGEDQKSVALHLTFGARDHTLDGAEVSAAQEKVVAALTKAGFPLR